MSTNLRSTTTIVCHGIVLGPVHYLLCSRNNLRDENTIITKIADQHSSP